MYQATMAKHWLITYFPHFVHETASDIRHSRSIAGQTQWTPAALLRLLRALPLLTALDLSRCPQVTGARDGVAASEKSRESNTKTDTCLSDFQKFSQYLASQKICK